MANPTPRAHGSRRNLYAALAAVAAIVVVVDQVTKSWALAALSDGDVELLSGFLTLRLTFNPGGAFSVLQGSSEFFIVATIVIVAVILWWARNITETSWAVFLGLVLGGGLGNLVDRLLRDTQGQVVDFIDVGFWPVFNVADSAISIGVVSILVLSFLEDRHERRSAAVEPPP